MAGSILSKALAEEVSSREIATASFKLGSGEPIAVGAYPLTPADFEAVNRKLKVTFQNDPTQFGAQVDMLIRKTRLIDPEGGLTDEKAFSLADRPLLMRLGVEKVSSMFFDLFEAQLNVDNGGDEDDEGEKGNS